MPTSRFHGGRSVIVLAADPDLAGIGLVEAGDQPQQRGLAAAGGAEKGEELARLDGEVDVLEDVVGAVGQVDVFDVDGDGGRGQRGAVAFMVSGPFPWPSGCAR